MKEVINYLHTSYVMYALNQGCNFTSKNPILVHAYVWPDFWNLEDYFNYYATYDAYAKK